MGGEKDVLDIYSPSLIGDKEIHDDFGYVIGKTMDDDQRQKWILER